MKRSVTLKNDCRKFDYLIFIIKLQTFTYQPKKIKLLLTTDIIPFMQYNTIKMPNRAVLDDYSINLSTYDNKR